MKRRVSVMGRPLKPMPKWRSLKEGDTVMALGGRSEPCTLVSVKRSKQTWGAGAAAYTVYYKKGVFLNLVTGESGKPTASGQRSASN